ncbi:hypothetical protein Geob_3707 [Geotalea daltonii FRC-32]|uniref:DUF5683 domain-containing protein n=1 Tax=Geotalea daltonii (strain DSM 22248 / JCM 15807 / FRC-32) TaxID=316067 RepID=B9M725_GEODF|nr:hypothetical protein [Geotalea daltonii]ACM22046.1 hypothetical protein Geob_3707 [Geotalea daltonii FRC-32]
MGMNLKAALLSGLVLPGLGQLYKGCKIKGSVMIALVNIFLIGALLFALKGVGKIIVSSKMPGSPDMQQVLETMRNDTPAARWLLAAFFGLWLYGVADALLGRKK